MALVNMPFAPATRPSLQLGILSGYLRAAGIGCDCFYFNMDFYQELRRRGWHSQYTSQVPSLVYEWYFSPRPFEEGLAGEDWRAAMWLENYCRSAGFPWKSMREIKQQVVPEFLDRIAARDFSVYDLVGFTMTYPQITASVALARRIKEQSPGTTVVFGGAGSQIHEDSARELMRLFDCLDVALLGEAEPVWVPLVKRLLKGSSPEGLGGILYRENGEIRRASGRRPEVDLEEPVFPDYDAYFEKLEELDPPTRALMERVLPIELGRGCAWGDHRTCKFCAFTFHGTFRRRSRERILAEVRHQIERYGRSSFYVVDDLVTNQMITDVFPELARVRPRVRIPFMEMRTAAGGPILDLLREAGVLMVQPGIESMDDGLLRKMSKGTTTYHNLLFLKGCRERGIRVSYNIILGFPDATAEELENQLRHLRLIPHLDPPFLVELSFVRFSPYWHERERYGLGKWRPHDFLRHIYPDGADLEKLAYEFSVDVDDRPHRQVYRRTVEWIRRWQDLWRSGTPPFLWYEEEDGQVVITDGRDPGSEPRIYRPEPVAGRVYALAMRKPLAVPRLLEALAAEGLPAGEGQVRAAIEDFLSRDLALFHREKLLALAVDRVRAEEGWRGGLRRHAAGPPPGLQRAASRVRRDPGERFLASELAHPMRRRRKAQGA